MSKRRSLSRGRRRGKRGPSSSSRSKPRKTDMKYDSSNSPPCEIKSNGWLDWLSDHDMRFSCWMQEQGPRIFFYLWLRILEFSGDGICLIPTAAVAYLLPKENLTPEVRTFFFNLLGAFIADLVLVTLVKLYVYQARPLYCAAHNIVTMEVEPWSFPSNHPTRALMVVTFFTMYLPMWKEQAINVWLPFFRRMLSNDFNILDEGVHMLANLLVSVLTWLVYSWAVATTSSRIILGRHFIFDVLVGCVVGILEGTLYNSFLVIPTEASEGVHDYIFSIFASIKDALTDFFNNGSLHIQGH